MLYKNILITQHIDVNMIMVIVYIDIIITKVGHYEYYCLFQTKLYAMYRN